MKLASAIGRWLAVGAFLGVACASSPEPQFYTLFPHGGRAERSAPLQVELRRPGLPGYLDRPQIVRHEQPEKLEFSGAARWGAPLEDMVGSIVVQNLAQRLPNASVYTESGAISADPDAVVELQIQRFELSERGAVELIAQVAVHWSEASVTQLDRYSLSRVPGNPSTTRLVTEMSALLADLANAIAETLRAGAVPSTPAEREAPASTESSE